MIPSTPTPSLMVTIVRTLQPILEGVVYPCVSPSLCECSISGSMVRTGIKKKVNEFMCRSER